MSQQAVEPLDTQEEKWTGNKTIDVLSDGEINPKTRNTPAVANFSNYLMVVCKGDDFLLYQCLRNAEGTWSKANVAGSSQNQIATSGAPSLAVFNDTLYLAYLSPASIDGENIVRLATLQSGFTGSTKWQELPELRVDKALVYSAHPPSLAVLGTGTSARLWLGWQTKGNDLFTATTSDGKEWSGNGKIKVGSDEAKSNYGPALCGYNNAMWVIFKGESSNKLRYATYDVATKLWSGNSTIEIQLGDTGTAKSDLPPGIAAFDGSLYITYKGEDSTDIRQAILTDQKWTGNRKIADISSISPATDITPGMATAVQEDGSEVLILANTGVGSSGSGIQIFVSELK